MKFLKNIILLLLVVFIIAAVYLATLDGSYEVSRTRLIKADQEVVFNDLNDYRNWKDWGPWYEQDSTIRVQYADNTIGEGGAYTWTSEVEGGGSIKTVEVVKPEQIKQEIIFETPFGDMKSDIYWNLNKQGLDTELTWGMKGELPFFSRFMASGMEDQLGPMLERGLELFDDNIQRKLKIYSIDSVGVVDFSGGFYLYLSTSSRIDQMNPKLEGMMQKIEKFVSDNRIRVTGSPYTIYHKFDQENGTTMFSVAYPIQERIITTDSDILTGFMERGTYLKTVLKGSYNNLEEAWQRAMFDAANLKDHVLEDGGEPFEIYVNSPENTPDPSKLITEIYIPVQMR
ncbi:effector binding domain-containing protein [Lutimonas saemankumensis]|uniref:SRPBCC family protein n=1 Tax=Lutimonas saemankumensis TaxID=483016 RepID=UPI001CD789A4|nr:GyrI-like domain-containing protein [Lutimonas saemankumensis]MCA0933515.1 effector binding domain-containing protein [Lutimonas saemankumensis]